MSTIHPWGACALGLMLGWAAAWPVDAQCDAHELMTIGPALPSAGAEFGVSVARRDDVLVVGTPGDDAACPSNPSCNSGAVYVFVRVDGTWVEQAKLTAADMGAGDRFGRHVALGDGVLVVGAPEDDDAGTNSGAAYVFRWNGDSWHQEAKLIAEDASAADRFGAAVALDGDAVIIGAWNYGSTPGEFDGSGAAYVFRYVDGTWGQEALLTASDAAVEAWFGSDVALAGDVALVGAMLDPHQGQYTGAAYVYRRVGGTWYEEAKLVAEDAAAGDVFGAAVAVEGARAVVGAYRDDANCPGDPDCDSGSAYVFTRTGGTWSQEARLEAPDATGGDQFGTAVALRGDLVLVGAAYGDGASANCGAAYLFAHTEDEWACAAKLTANDGAPEDGFGFDRAVALTAGRLFVGAYQHGGGAVYEFAGLEDCNANGALDLCDVATGVSLDCNANGEPDECDLAGGGSGDVDGDGVPDECQPDCNGNGVPDGYDIATGASADCNGNDVPDECESQADCNENGVLDICDLASGASEDCNGNEVPDECEPPADCNENGVQDICDLAAGTSQDCDGNGVPDECDLAGGTAQDCNLNGVPDGCDIAGGSSADVDGNGVPDECEADCNDNGVVDALDIAGGTSTDCDGNEVPDECQVGAFEAASAALGPVAADAPVSYVIDPAPIPGSDVTVTIAAVADLGASAEWLNVALNGTALGALLASDGHDCPAEADVATLVVTAEAFIDAVGAGPAVVEVSASAAVDGASCPAGSVTIALTCFEVTEDDCNANGVPDLCDILDGTSGDADGSGVPDECEVEPAIFVVSGVVHAVEGVGLANVVLSGFPEDAVTGADGAYAAEVEEGWSGTVVPALAGYSFEPVSRAYENVVADHAYDDFEAIPLGAGPVVVTQPESGRVCAGAAHTFCVAATGDALVYQWDYRVGAGWHAIEGAEAACYATTTAGLYRCVVSNLYGTVYSEWAALQVDALLTWYRDTDGDGWGVAAESVVDCVQPVGCVSRVGDCDDTRADVYPGAVEILGDGVDNNCDGVDTVGWTGSDCNANGVSDADDLARGVSADCDANGVPDECQVDSDGDGVIDACAGMLDTWPGDVQDVDQDAGTGSGADGGADDALSSQDVPDALRPIGCGGGACGAGVVGWVPVTLAGLVGLRARWGRRAG